MAKLRKRLALLGITAPVALGVYWALTDTGPLEAGPLAIASPLGIGSTSGGDPDHDLRRLSILEHDLYIIKSRYVEKDRLDAEAMFDGALEEVEREVAEVMFVRAPGGDKLHISAGAFSTILPLSEITDLDDLYSQLSRVARILDDNLSQEISRADVEYAIINGALSTLDPHSVLLPPVAAEEMDVDNQGEFGGLGVEITSRDGRLLVKHPMPDTPASRAGLKSDDHIVRIEDESTINMDLDEAVSRLRGEVGSPVNIEVMRKGRSRAIPFQIVRAVIRINPVEGELLEGDIGYVRIKAFHASVAADLADLLTRFRRESGGEVRGLILDMRSNPGGYLNQAIKVCDLFLRDGVIVTTVEGGDRHFDHNHAKDDGDEPDYPIAVLVNSSSASASEIVAGALRNQRRAIIIGERSFGKGSVQHLYDHRADNSRLKLTVAQYLTPGEKSIQSVGIPPDIYLQPSVIDSPESDDDEPVVSLYWREWVDREADLDHHLDHDSAEAGEDAYYQLRYLKPRSEGDGAAELDLNEDWEVRLSRELLLASPTARPTDLLQSAAPIIARYEQQEALNIAAAFEEVGIDWTDGLNGPPLSIDVALDLGDDGVLRVGEPEPITVSVTNTGDVDIFQLSAYTDADSPALSHREFYFGRIAPGETRSFSQRVSLPVGYGDEIAPLTLTFRDPRSSELLVMSKPVRIEGQRLPKLAYTLKLFDDGSGSSDGDGDGIPEVGEVIDAELVVTNHGEGPTGEGYARLKNRSGRDLDLRRGTIELGKLRGADGEPCDDPDAEGCRRVLQPGESHAGRFTFELRTLPEGGEWTVELHVGDNKAYDYASISQGGFYDYFQLQEEIHFTPVEPVSLPLRQAPQIEVTRQPELLTPEGEAVVSGVVRDDKGVRDVMIFHDEDKVFFRGGVEGGTELPFTVEQGLDDDVNHLYILARDFQGLTATYAIRTWHDGSGISEPVVQRRPEE